MNNDNFGLITTLFFVGIYVFSIFMSYMALTYENMENNNFMLYYFKIPKKVGKIIILTPIINTIFGLLWMLVFMCILSLVIHVICIIISEIYHVMFPKKDDDYKSEF